MYEIIIKPRAEKEFAKLPKELQEKFYIEFEKLSKNPFAHPNIKKLKEPSLAGASGLIDGVFCLPYFPKKDESKF